LSELQISNSSIYLTESTLLKPYIKCKITIFAKGERRELQPKEDLTAFELYNINTWVNEANANFMPENLDALYERMFELKIDRHFICLE